MTLMLQMIGLLAGIAIFWRVEPVLNLMTPHCRLSVRLAVWLLTVGACGLILTITQGYVPTPPVLCVTVGTALLLASERRIRGLLRLHNPTNKERRTV